MMAIMGVLYFSKCTENTCRHDVIHRRFIREARLSRWLNGDSENALAVIVRSFIMTYPFNGGL